MLDELTQQALFDYNSLDTDTRAFVQEKAQAIHARLKRTAEDVIAIGIDLIEVKAKLGHGQFIDWLNSEFDLTRQSAANFMRVAERFGQAECKTVLHLPIRILYELASPSTPETIIDMVEAGTISPTLTAIREIKRDFQRQEPVQESLDEVNEQEEEGFNPRYDHTKPAYCKYCYATHNDWQLSGNHDGIVWICQECDHATRDEFMQIEDEKPADTPLPTREITPDELPPTWNHVNGKPFTAPLPDGKPIVIPESWKLSPEIRITPIIEPVIDIERETRREQARERIESLRANGVDLPTGKYSCIVIDPPWTMQKIERDVRPNQVEFDYPTMSEEELKAFALPDMAADDCHLYLWTTQKHLPLALRLAEHWGFTYQCIMTWIKNVGFTPFSWMYSTEHVLFCRKGSLPLLQIGRRLDFYGKVREHSRKPDEFYDLVKAVSPGPRIDVFSRQKRDDFDQFGNEVEKFV